MLPSRLLLCFFLVLAAAGTAPLRADDARLSPEEVRAEFDLLYRQLRDSHYDLYARRPRAEYDALHRRMRAAMDAPLAPDEVEARFRRFVAYGNVAHARIDLPAAAWERFRAGGGKAFPLFVKVVDGRVHVTDDFSGSDEVAPGDRLHALDGRPIEAWLQRLRRHVAADSDYMAHTLFEPILPLLLWLERGERAAFEVEIEDAAGRRRTFSLPARSRAEFEAAAAQAPAAPASDWTAREARVLEGGVAYLRPGPFYDARPEAATPWDNTEFLRFIDSAFADFLAAGADILLIDLRDNPGGDNSFSDPMLAWFATRPFRFASRFEVRSSRAARESNRARLDPTAGPDAISARYEAQYARHAPGERFEFEIPEVAPRAGRRFTGRVFVLINRHSYSNTVLVAAVAQDYGFATVLGEETADLASTYGAMEQFTLPRTGLVVGFPKARILRPSGATQARGVIPDVAIATPIVAGADDVVLRRALEIARSSGNVVPADEPVE